MAFYLKQLNSNNLLYTTIDSNRKYSNPVYNCPEDKTERFYGLLKLCGAYYQYKSTYGKDRKFNSITKKKIRNWDDPNDDPVEPINPAKVRCTNPNCNIPKSKSKRQWYRDVSMCGACYQYFLNHGKNRNSAQYKKWPDNNEEIDEFEKLTIRCINPNCNMPRPPGRDGRFSKGRCRQCNRGFNKNKKERTRCRNWLTDPATDPDD